MKFTVIFINGTKKVITGLGCYKALKDNNISILAVKKIILGAVNN